MDDYHERMDRHVASGLTKLPDYNLDTGVAGPAAGDYRLAVMTEQQLNKYRGT